MNVIRLTHVMNPDVTVARVSLHERIYIWSLIAEPLLFFVLSDRSVTGFPITLSRTLQILFWCVFLFQISLNYKKTTIPNLFNASYQYISLYVFLIIIASIVGIFSGAYVTETWIFNKGVNDGITQVITGTYSRPLFEVFILLYYFLYFLILPKYILRTSVQLHYLLRWTLRVFAFVVVLGLIDVFFSPFGLELIPRHLIDSRWVGVGIRFHGLAGEPRDAFVYLLYGIAILYLSVGLNQTAAPGRALIAILVGCLVLTQSFSGIVGLSVGLTLLLIFTRLSLKNIITVFSLMIVVLSIIYLAAINSDRLQLYFGMIERIPDLMDQKELPFVVYVQSPDIVPLWFFIKRIMDFDLYYLLFGSGIGSASFATNNFLNEYGMNNPRAQLTRLLFESGIIGLYVYLLILINPVRRLCRDLHKKHGAILWVCSALLFGATLGHRSNLGLIFAGIVLAIIINRLYILDPGRSYSRNAAP